MVDGELKVDEANLDLSPPAFTGCKHPMLGTEELKPGCPGPNGLRLPREELGLEVFYSCLNEIFHVSKILTVLPEFGFLSIGLHDPPKPSRSVR
ncbi:unnamed protein product [Symbiodinium sp. KB8]|nr:unnamed protein product [Symbiodinium sp. KB8]